MITEMTGIYKIYESSSGCVIGLLETSIISLASIVGTA